MIADLCRPIGSVLPFPGTVAGMPFGDSIWAAWTAGYRTVSAFRNARGALAALLRLRAVRRIWLPAYICPVVAEAAGACDCLWYDVDAALNPDLASLRMVRPGDAVVVVDYFGRPVAAEVRALAMARRDVLWIQDRAQALDPGEPGWGDVVLYSPRKLVGVGEGGLLVGNAPLPQPSGEPQPHASAAQHSRRADPLGSRRRQWFTAFQAQEAAMAIDDRPMGPDVASALRHIPIRPLADRRRQNAAILTTQLADLLLWPSPSQAYAPLAVPIRIADRDTVAANLATHGIFCARHWAALPSDPARFRTAHRLAAELLSLPCDDSYGATEMERIVSVLRSLNHRSTLPAHPCDSVAIER